MQWCPQKVVVETVEEPVEVVGGRSREGGELENMLRVEGVWGAGRRAEGETPWHFLFSLSVPLRLKPRTLARGHVRIIGGS